LDLDDALLLEQPLHRARLSELPVVPGERGAHLGGRAVPAVGRGLDHDRHAAGAVALVHDALDLGPVRADRRPVDRPLEVRKGHVQGAGPIHRQAEPEVAVGIAATLTGREHDLARHLREDRAAFHVVGALLALDLGPLGMTGHRLEYFAESHSFRGVSKWLQSRPNVSATSHSPVTAAPGRPRSSRRCSISWARPPGSARWMTGRASSTPIPRSTSAGSRSTWPSPRSPTTAPRSTSSTPLASPTSPGTSTPPSAWPTRRSSWSTAPRGSRSAPRACGTSSRPLRRLGSSSSRGSIARTPTSTTS